MLDIRCIASTYYKYPYPYLLSPVCTVHYNRAPITTKEASGRSETGSPQHSGLKIATALLQAVENGVVAKIVVVEQGVDCANPA